MNSSLFLFLGIGLSCHNRTLLSHTYHVRPVQYIVQTRPTKKKVQTRPTPPQQREDPPTPSPHPPPRRRGWRLPPGDERALASSAPGSVAAVLPGDGDACSGGAGGGTRCSGIGKTKLHLEPHKLTLFFNQLCMTMFDGIPTEVTRT